jgi:hypothetical protein
MMMESARMRREAPQRMSSRPAIRESVVFSAFVVVPKSARDQNMPAECALFSSTYKRLDALVVLVVFSRYYPGRTTTLREGIYSR